MTVCGTLFDEEAFLSPHGLRSISKRHTTPYTVPGMPTAAIQYDAAGAARRSPPRRPRRHRHPTTPHVGWPAPHWSSAGLGWDWRWSCGDGQ